MDNIYSHKGTKLLFQANPAPGFVNLSLDDGAQHNNLSHEFSFQLWQEPMTAEGRDMKAISPRYMA